MSLKSEKRNEQARRKAEKERSILMLTGQLQSRLQFRVTALNKIHREKESIVNCQQFNFSNQVISFSLL